MRWIILVGFLFAFCLPAAAEFWIGEVAAPPAGWQQVAEGAGGFQQGHDIASDNSYIVRTDTGGAYLWNPNGTAPNGTSGVWQQLVTATSMPASYVAAAQLYDENNIGGVWEIRFDYANSQYVYMVKAVVQLGGSTVNCGVYSSSNKGTTWTQLSGFTPIACNTYFPTNDSNYKFYGSKIAIDPGSTPPQNIYVGSQGDGLFVSTNGGTSFSQISSGTLPFGTGAGITGLEVYSGNLFACVNGTGVYESSNQGSSFIQLTSGTGPTQCSLTGIDHNNGDYYAVDGTCTNLWVWNGSTWSKILTSSALGSVCSDSIAGIAVDPNLSGHIVVADGQGNLNESFNNGSSWSGFSGSSEANPPSLSTTGDITWQATLSNNKSLYTQGLFFDQSSTRNRSGTPVANKLYINGENNFFSITLSGDIATSTAITANSQGRGIEQLVGNLVTASPTSTTTVLFGVWDHGIFGYSNAALNTYPSAISPVNSTAICATWTQDYAAGSPSSIIALCDGDYASTTNQTSFSSNGGSSWTQYTSSPANYSTCSHSATTNCGQNIAVSTSSNCLWAPAGSVLPAYSTNCNSASATWTTISLPGSPSLSNFLTFYEGNNLEIAADRVNMGSFYLAIPSGHNYFTTNGGSSWTAAGSTPSNGSQIQLKATPGEAADVWFSAGYSGNPGQQPNGTFLYHSTNAASAGQTFTQLTNIGSPYCIGFGAPAPSQSYPSLYVVGYALDASTSTVTIGTGTKTFTVSTGSTYYPVGQYVVVQEGSLGTFSDEMVGQVTAYNSATGALTLNVLSSNGSGSSSNWVIGVFGPWESDNQGSTWKMLGTQQWPNSGLFTARDCMGDPNIYGRMYISLSDGAVYYP